MQTLEELLRSQGIDPMTADADGDGKVSLKEYFDMLRDPDFNRGAPRDFGNGGGAGKNTLKNIGARVNDPAGGGPPGPPHTPPGFDTAGARPGVAGTHPKGEDFPGQNEQVPFPNLGTATGDPAANGQVPEDPLAQFRPEAPLANPGANPGGTPGFPQELLSGAPVQPDVVPEETEGLQRVGLPHLLPPELLIGGRRATENRATVRFAGPSVRHGRTGLNKPSHRRRIQATTHRPTRTAAI